jgi:chemotaxis protein methyltransferase CheR
MSSDLFDKFRFGSGSPKPSDGQSGVPALAKPGQSDSTAAQPLSPASIYEKVGAVTSALIAADTNSPKMDDETFRRYRDFIYEQCGIAFTENKKYLLEGRIAKRLEAHGLTSFDEYFKLINSATHQRDELPNLFETVTINETYFFRNPPQFEALEQVIIPEILRAKQDSPSAPKKLRIWSAASSSGEEAHTLAMILLDKIKPQFPNFQFEIVGTDISAAVLEKARAGVYKEYAVRNMPPYYLNKYFTREGDRFILAPEVKSIVKFMSANLYDTPTMRTMSSFDVVFCCNVLIYFDTPAKQQVVANLYDALNKGGYLFIGYSESLHGVSRSFKLVHFPKTIAYKKE